MIRCNYSDIEGRDFSKVPCVWTSFETVDRSGLKIRTEPFLALIDTGSDATWIPKHLVPKDAKFGPRRQVRIFNSDKVLNIRTYIGNIYLIDIDKKEEIMVECAGNLFVTEKESGLIGLDIINNFVLSIHHGEYITIE